MKNHLVATLTVLAVLGGSVSPAFAYDVGGIRGFFQRFRSERLQDVRQNQQQGDRTQFRDELASKSQELRLRLQQKHDEDLRARLQNFWGKAVQRLQKLIDREHLLTEKIAQRLATFKAAGKDVSEQEALLETARDAVTAAQTELDTAVDEMHAFSGSAADMVTLARRLHSETVTAIRAAHAALVDVIVSTRGMSMTPSPTPSATATP